MGNQALGRRGKVGLRQLQIGTCTQGMRVTCLEGLSYRLNGLTPQRIARTMGKENDARPGVCVQRRSTSHVNAPSESSE